MNCTDLLQHGGKTMRHQKTLKKMKTCMKCGSIFELHYTHTLLPSQNAIFCEICNEILEYWDNLLVCHPVLIEAHQDHLPIALAKR